jgi:hypothetical protein
MRRFNVGWKTKAAAFRLFNSIPAGSTLHYLTQRHITRTIPRDLSAHDGWQVEHARAFQRFFRGDLGQAHLFEFGAGWDLHSSLVQWCYGINNQSVFDISRLAKLELVNLTIRHLRAHPPEGSSRIPEVPLREPLDDSLRRNYGIHYLAPADARRTGLASGSVDLICTTSVLEHIPPADLRAIMTECRRIANEAAIVSHVVDYTDHYAQSDRSIGPYNFLRYSERQWQAFNPAIHYQNRLRHFQFGELFAATGFRVLGERAMQPDRATDALKDFPLADEFSNVAVAQLLPATGHWVIAPR